MRAEEASQRIVRLGFVGPLSPATLSLTPFWERLRELGWVEGQNLVVEARSADGHLERLPDLMAEVIDRKVDVLVTYGMPGAIAAKQSHQHRSQSSHGRWPIRYEAESSQVWRARGQRDGPDDRLCRRDRGQDARVPP